MNVVLVAGAVYFKKDDCGWLFITKFLLGACCCCLLPADTIYMVDMNVTQRTQTCSLSYCLDTYVIKLSERDQLQQTETD